VASVGRGLILAAARKQRLVLIRLTALSGTFRPRLFDLLTSAENRRRFEKAIPMAIYSEGISRTESGTRRG